MKKEFKLFSIICSILALVLSVFVLIIGLNSIGSTGLDGITIVCIPISIIAIVIILVDFLISIDIIKKGLTYSYISTILKGFILFPILSTLPGALIFFIKDGAADFLISLFLVVWLLLMAAPSFMNIKKLKKNR